MVKFQVKKGRMIKSTLYDEGVRNKRAAEKVEQIYSKVTVGGRRASQKAISRGDFNIPLPTSDPFSRSIFPTKNGNYRGLGPSSSLFLTF